MKMDKNMDAGMESSLENKEVIIENVDLEDTGTEAADILPAGEGGQGFVFDWLDAHVSLMKIVMPVAGAALIILVLIILAVSGGNSNKKTMKESFVSSTPRQEETSETENAMNDQEVQKPETTQEPAEMQETDTSQVMKPDAVSATPMSTGQAEEIRELEKNLVEAEDSLQSLHDMFFGESGQSASLGCVTTVTGFTDREKREIGFLESDFLKDAGAFLAKQQIQTKRIIIEDRIASSSDAGIAFQGRLEGKDDYILDILFYPDLPGEYVFLIRNVKGNERGNSAGSETQSSGQNSDQNASQTQNGQNTAPAQDAGQPAVTPQNTTAAETAAPPQNSYDATNLSVKKIPETLLNYIDNRYEFQYSLYDWLYNHGKKEVGSASVTDYSIDGDARQAMIELQLSDGGSLTATYDKASNTYSFKR